MEITQEQLNSCFSIADVCRFIGWVPSGDNYRRAKELIKDLDTSHFRKGPWNKGRKVKIDNITLTLEEILVENSPIRNTSKLKERLFKEGLKEEKCEICGYSENLELHHINGDPTDNRLENLQILCPNHHAKTPNFRGKNKEDHKRSHIPANQLFLSDADVVKRYEDNLKKKREREREKYHKDHPDAKTIDKTTKIIKVCPTCGNEFEQTSKRIKYCSRECQQEAMSNNKKRPNFLELVSKLKELKNFTQVGNYYDVSDNCIRKWCNLYQIPTHTKEMQEYVSKIIENN